MQARDKCSTIRLRVKEHFVRCKVERRPYALTTFEQFGPFSEQSCAISAPPIVLPSLFPPASLCEPDEEAEDFDSLLYSDINSPNYPILPASSSIAVRTFFKFSIDIINIRQSLFFSEHK